MKMMILGWYWLAACTRPSNKENDHFGLARFWADIGLTGVWLLPDLIINKLMWLKKQRKQTSHEFSICLGTFLKKEMKIYFKKNLFGNVNIKNNILNLSFL